MKNTETGKKWRVDKWKKRETDRGMRKVYYVKDT